ncbi:hypothetical protein HaLaN_05299 [Haematococcus lacustris]|uniref:Uncharacterized protein n=1 Tax=Haematococcus lacustris TaxID=44745 RepID=A0A699Z3Q5_HAELA|nr:hypothetical protein HaLaN_05299 [Haematococcus lacustris]
MKRCTGKREQLHLAAEYVADDDSDEDVPGTEAGDIALGNIDNEAGFPPYGVATQPDTMLPPHLEPHTPHLEQLPQHSSLKGTCTALSPRTGHDSQQRSRPPRKERVVPREPGPPPAPLSYVTDHLDPSKPLILFDLNGGLPATCAATRARARATVKCQPQCRVEIAMVSQAKTGWGEEHENSPQACSCSGTHVRLQSGLQGGPTAPSGARPGAKPGVRSGPGNQARPNQARAGAAAGAGAAVVSDHRPRSEVLRVLQARPWWGLRGGVRGPFWQGGKSRQRAGQLLAAPLLGLGNRAGRAGTLSTLAAIYLICHWAWGSKSSNMATSQQQGRPGRTHGRHPSAADCSVIATSVSMRGAGGQTPTGCTTLPPYPYQCVFRRYICSPYVRCEMPCLEVALRYGMVALRTALLRIAL